MAIGTKGEVAKVNGCVSILETLFRGCAGYRGDKRGAWLQISDPLNPEDHMIIPRSKPVMAEDRGQPMMLQFP